jgi:hypothetical protein
MIRFLRDESQDRYGHTFQLRAGAGDPPVAEQIRNFINTGTKYGKSKDGLRDLHRRQDNIHTIVERAREHASSANPLYI